MGTAKQAGWRIVSTAKREVWVIEWYVQTAIDGTHCWEPYGAAHWFSDTSAIASMNQLLIRRDRMRVVRYVPAPTKPKRRPKRSKRK